MPQSQTIDRAIQIVIQANLYNDALDGEKPCESLLMVSLRNKFTVSFNSWKDATLFPNKHSVEHFILKYDKKIHRWAMIDHQPS